MIQTIASASSSGNKGIEGAESLPNGFIPDEEKSVLKESNTDEHIGQASLSGRILLMSNSNNDRRAGLGGNKMRTSGLMSVPKAGTILPSDAAYDLFFLEKKLGELGFMSGGSNNIGRNNSALTSALGESFMLLSTTASRRGNKTQFSRSSASIPFGASDSLRNPQQDEHTRPHTVRHDNQVKNLAAKVHGPSDVRTVLQPSVATSTFSGPYGGIKKPKIPPGDQQRTLSTGTGSSKNGTFWLPNPIDILTWRGAKASVPQTTSAAASTIPNKISNEVHHDVTFENSQFDLNWNDDQSMFNAIPDKIAKKNHEKSNANQKNIERVVNDSIPKCNNNNDSSYDDNNNNNNNNNNNDIIDNEDYSCSNNISPSDIQGYFISSQSQSQQILSAVDNSNNNDNNNNDNNNNNNNNDNNNNNNDYNNNSKSNSNNGNNNLRESELRLLQSIKRLGDENYALLHRIEVLSSVETKNLELRKEMSSFKKEFQERFLRLKEVLREFQRKNSKDGNVATFGIEFGAVIGSNVGEGGGNVEKSKNDIVSTTSGSRTGAVSDNIAIGVNPAVNSNEKENVRQQQLERTVLALIKRLEEVSQSVSQSISLSVCLFVCLSVCLSVCQSVSQPVRQTDSQVVNQSNN